MLLLIIMLLLTIYKNIIRYKEKLGVVVLNPRGDSYHNYDKNDKTFLSKFFIYIFLLPQ